MTGWIDPRVTPSTTRERRLLEECRRLGLNVHRLHAEGQAVRVTGPGCHIVAASLGAISVDDLPDRATGGPRRRD